MAWAANPSGVAVVEDAGDTQLMHSKHGPGGRTDRVCPQGVCLTWGSASGPRAVVQLEMSSVQRMAKAICVPESG